MVTLTSNINVPSPISTSSCRTETVYSKGENPSLKVDHSQDDAMSDEDFNRLYNEPRVRQVDHIENTTLKIFTHLQSLTDKENRSAIEKAIETKDLSLDEENGINQEFNEAPRFQHELPFRNKTNFDETKDFEQPIRAKHIFYNLASALESVFFGYEFFQSNQSKSYEEMNKELKISEITWNQVLKEHYLRPFNNIISDAFVQASELLTIRKKFINESFYQRITLYCLLMISIGGKLMTQHLMSTLAFTGSVLTFIFMLIHYSSFSFKQSQITSTLKTSVEIAEREACRSRTHP